MRIPSTVRSLWVAFLFLSPMMLSTASANTFGKSLGPDPKITLDGRLDYLVVGASHLMCNALGCSGLPNSSATVTGFPEGAAVSKAYLVWSASKRTNAELDNSVTFGPPNAAPNAVVANLEEDCHSVTQSVDSESFSWFSCTADVTDVLNAHTGMGLDINGPYYFGDFSVESGPTYQLPRFVVGSWSLVIIYEKPDPAPFKSIHFYSGFRHLYGEVATLQPSGFEVPADGASHQARVTVHGVMGRNDATGDAIRVDSTPIFDDCNPADNIFNATIHTGLLNGESCTQQVRGMDLDSFDVSHLVNPGARTTYIEIAVPNERVLLNYVLFSTDTIERVLDLSKRSIPASGSQVWTHQTIEYHLDLYNKGVEDVKQLVLTDEIPEDTTYIPNTTCVNGLSVPDVEPGISPLESGLMLDELIGGILMPGQENAVNVVFQVRVNQGLVSQHRIQNTASAQADIGEPVTSNEVAHRMALMDTGVGDRPHPCPPENGDEDAGELLDTGMGEDAQVPSEDAETGDHPDAGETPVCDPGTHLVDGHCVPLPEKDAKDDDGCGCALSALGGIRRPGSAGYLMLSLLALLAYGLHLSGKRKWKQNGNCCTK